MHTISPIFRPPLSHTLPQCECMQPLNLFLSKHLLSCSPLSSHPCLICDAAHTTDCSMTLYVRTLWSSSKICGQGFGGQGWEGVQMQLSDAETDEKVFTTAAPQMRRGAQMKPLIGPNTNHWSQLIHTVCYRGKGLTSLNRRQLNDWTRGRWSEVISSPLLSHSGDPSLIITKPLAQLKLREFITTTQQRAQTTACMKQRPCGQEINADAEMCERSRGVKLYEAELKLGLCTNSPILSHI